MKTACADKYDKIESNVLGLSTVLVFLNLLNVQ